MKIIDIKAVTYRFPIFLGLTILVFSFMDNDKPCQYYFFICFLFSCKKAGHILICPAPFSGFSGILQTRITR